MKEEDRIESDLLFLQTYMAAISTADIKRDQIFEHASEKKEYVVSKYLKKVFLLVKNLGYEYSKACKLMAKKVKNPMLKNFFGGLAIALSSGEEEKEFLRSEMDTMVTIYSNKYELDIESLKKWTDGYTALLVSSTLIVVVILISGMLYPIGDMLQMTFLTGFMVIGVSGLGIYIISRAAPKEIKIHSLPDKTKEQRLIKKLSLILLPIAAISIVALLLLHETLSQHNINPIGFVLIVAAALVVPIGIVGMKDDRLIDKRDNDCSSFLKSLGSLAGTTGVATSAALAKLDRDSAGSLEHSVKRLNARLSKGLEKGICWNKFVGETGSELINRCAGIFNDAIDLGGDPAKIGGIVSSSSLRICLLRMKRKMVSSGFTGLVIPLHAIMAGLVLFIVQLMLTFSSAITKLSAGGSEAIASTGMNVFTTLGSGDIAFLSNYAIVIVIILTIANAVVLKIVDGGGNYKFFYYGPIITVISGMELIVVPIIASMMFSMFQV